ncbi:alpha-2-macroglobulin family protein [Yersinia pekkanenii]|uniref:Alpha-2-macroglobulin n=1 Tax=Yersinia pekkanenii TaxID=1288385 RepID=A0A0T9NDT9_9GAMM|nr:alpha-2-macroglobulin [Yersinia pekkanenii]CNH01292.1 alpha-2-macroglobulin [Yersinia pekkanenii]CRY64053.1 alpha-2-macroglobulin [Yersinia pekkanenii]
MNYNGLHRLMSGINGYRAAILVGAALLLAACDDSNNNGVTASPGTQSSAAVAKVAVSKPADAAALAELAKRHAGQPFTLLDASELQLDGASAMVLTFSQPLDSNQDFASQVHLVDTVSGNIDGAWELSDNLMELRLRHLKPERKLLLTVDSSLKGVTGAELGQQQQQQITTRDIKPSVGFASKGSLLPGELAQGLPVMALNVNNVDVNFFRIKQSSLANFLATWQYRSALSNWESDELLKMADLVYTGRFDLNPAANTREKLLLPLADIKPLQESGVYLAVMQQAGHYSYTHAATLFTLSDIGVSLHSYHNRMDVFTQALAGGAALKGVSLQLLDGKGQVLIQAETDEQGHAQLENNANAKLLLASQNGQTSLIDLSAPALDLAEFDIAGPEGFQKQFFVFGPRDLYRPGETLIVNGLLRDANGKPLSTQPVKVDILKPDNKIVRSFVWQPQEGLYQYQYAIPQGGPTGEWSLRFNLGDNPPRFYKFKVEDFLPERLALDIATGKEPIATDSEASFAITGRYLYGAPASGNRLQGQLFLRPLREAVATLPGFEFGSVTEENLSRTLDEFDTTLDSDGQTDVTVDNSWQNAQSPLKLILQASLLESGGRPVTRRAEQALWPADALVGIRPLFNKQQVYDYRSDSYKSQAMVSQDTQADFEIVYANADGDKLAADGLKVKLIRERRDYYWQWSESDGWQSLFDKKDLTLAEQRVSIAANGSAKVSFPVEWGAYRIEVSNPDNSRVSSSRFWAGYSWQDNTAGSGAVRPDQVKLTLDKPAYRPGDQVKLHIEAPVAGNGYLLVESSDGPLWWQEVTIPAGGTEVDVPINHDWDRHDLYLSATVIRPGDKAQQATPKRAIGLLHLPLVDETRKLALQLDAPARIRPNQTLTVKVKASRTGAPLPEKVQVLLSAVDSGILNITDYATPDPYDAFFGRKRYSADRYDVYGQLIEGQGRLASLRFGGDGDEEDALSRGGKKPITEVTIVAQQAQPVTLNAQGEGTVELAIPDFNGELRLMAQAWSDKDFGKAESKVVVAAPLIAQLATPRFLAGGDRTQLALDLSNLSGQAQTLSLNLAASDLLALEGAATQSIALASGERKTVLIPVRALNGFGQGDIGLTITGMVLPDEKLADYQHHWKIGVRPAYPAQTRHFANVLRSGESWSLSAEAIAGLSAETLQGQLLVTSRPPLNLARYISELYAYPYGCLEQTVSGLYPSLYSNHAQLTALGIKADSDEKRRQTIDIGIEHLLSMQRYNGSFGLWSNSSPEEFWLTAYATGFLYRASQQGYSVPVAALTAANNRLQRYLQDPNQVEIRYSEQSKHTRFAVQAYAGLVLAQQQQASLGALRQLYTRSSDARSGLPLVQLGVALKLMGDMPRAKTAITQGLNTTRSDKDYWLEDYGSSVRDDALILALLTDNNLLPEARDTRLLALSDALFGRNYLSTQESNALFLAGRTLINGAETPWQVAIAQQAESIDDSATLTQSTALNQNWSAQQLAGGMQLQNRGDSALYSRVDVVGYPQHAPAPFSNNLHISRRYIGLDGHPLQLSQLKSGELLLVHLDIWADKRVPDALVVDLLPAGLELENQNLGDSNASLGDSASRVTELLQDMQQSDIKHQEFRDDRYVAAVSVDGYRHTTLLYLARAVTPGVYQVPAPQVESMYVPDWRALGGTPAQLQIVK